MQAGSSHIDALAHGIEAQNHAILYGTLAARTGSKGENKERMGHPVTDGGNCRTDTPVKVMENGAQITLNVFSMPAGSRKRREED